MSEINENVLFVNGLPWATDDQALREHFEGSGNVLEATVQVDRRSGRSRGHGLVTFETPAEAKAALEALNGSDLGGRYLAIKFDGAKEAVKENKLFVNGLPWETDDQALLEHFEGHGNCLDATVQVDRRSGRSRGFGLVTFETPAEAKAAMEALNGSELGGRTLAIKFDGSKEEFDNVKREFVKREFVGVKEEVSQNKLFVNGLPWETDDQALREHFEGSGNVVEATVQVDRRSGRSRGFGLVTFKTPAEAKAALEALDGSDLGGRSLAIKFDDPRGGSKRGRY